MAHLIELSPRLKKVSHWVRANDYLADIGTDHAHLPIHLIQNKKIPGAIASEIARGPYKNAQQTIQQAGLNNKIQLILGDGLEILEEASVKPGTISICGMGGQLIRHILAEGLTSHQLPQSSRLVLQANNQELFLREWLVKNDYVIIGEEIVRDAGVIYETIIAEKGRQPEEYNQDELVFGPYLLREKGPLFIQKWTEQKKHLENVYYQMRGASRPPIEKMREIEREINRIEGVIS